MRTEDEISMVYVVSFIKLTGLVKEKVICAVCEVILSAYMTTFSEKVGAEK